VVLTPSAESGLLGHHLASDGSLYSTIIVPAGGTREPISPEALSAGRQMMAMRKGREVFRHGIELMARAGLAALENAHLDASSVDWLIPHQANTRMIYEAAHRMGIPEEKTISVVAETGNSSSATIPLAIGIAARQGKFRRGDTLLLTAVGAGMISAGAVLRW
jgi:3-oxoacyl-[acyl-carrier-protein] synthase III